MVFSVFRAKGANSAVAAAVAKCRSAFVSALVLSLLINLLLLTGSIYMLQVYDRVLTSRSVPTLVALTVLIGVLFAFMALFDVIRTRIMARVGGRIDDELRQQAFDSVIEHALKKTPNVGTQPVRDLETVRQFVYGPGMFALFDLPWAPLYLIVCYLFHPLVGHYALAGSIVLFLLAILNERVTRSMLGEVAGASIRSYSMTEEARRSAEVLRAMGMLAAYRERWSKMFGRNQALNMFAGDRANMIAAITKAMRLFMQSAILGLGAWLVIRGELTPGVMIASSILMSRAVAPVEQVIAHWRGAQMARASYERLTAHLGKLQTVDSRMPLPAADGRLTVEPLVITAPGTSDKPLLQGVQFTLQPGEGLGIIGPTGSGKSTLARALVGVWQPQRGAVRLDGHSLDQWQPEQLGRSIGYLPQEVELFAGTVEENIARFDPDPDPEEVVKAAKAAHVHDMIGQLPKGYATELGEAGARLSGGQRQRIGLARALYGNPKLIVLDEPNSNLDPAGEIALVAALDEARANGATVVVIAHRINVLKSVDKALYLVDGKQVVFGPKQAVLEKAFQPVRQSKKDDGSPPSPNDLN
jgi:ATP-binding cassette subfamily C protein